MRESGAFCEAYLDDFLLLSSSLAQALRSTRRLTWLLRAIGLPVNLAKLAEEGFPAPQLTFLGVDFDTDANAMGLSPRRRAKLGSLLLGVCRRSWVSARTARHVAGLLSFFTSVYHRARAFAASWWAAAGGVCDRRRCAHQPRCPALSRVRVGADMRRDAAAFLRLLRVAARVPILVPAPHRWVAFSDASLVGFGAHCGPWHFKGRWTDRELRWATGAGSVPNIYVLETITAVMAVEVFSARLGASHLRLRVDNRGTEGSLRSWRSTLPLVRRMLRRLVEVLVHRGVQLSVDYVTTTDNATADALSRPGRRLVRLTSPCDSVGFPVLPCFQTACSWRSRQAWWGSRPATCLRVGVRRGTGRRS
jgi:hypothetical protein